MIARWGVNDLYGGRRREEAERFQYNIKKEGRRPVYENNGGGILDEEQPREVWPSRKIEFWSRLAR